MDNFSDSEFTLVLCVSHRKEQNKKIEKCNWIPLRDPKGDEESIFEKKMVWLGAKIVTRSKEKTKVKATFN